jgi:hypothetical protein
MQGPKYINTNIIYQLNDKYSHILHFKKLRDIKNRKFELYQSGFMPKAFESGVKTRWKSLFDSKL